MRFLGRSGDNWAINFRVLSGNGCTFVVTMNGFLDLTDSRARIAEARGDSVG